MTNKLIMKTIRITLLFVLGMITMFGIFCEPADDSATWLSDLAVSKLIGLAALASAWAVNRYWPAICSAIQKAKSNKNNIQADRLCR